MAPHVTHTLPPWSEQTTVRLLRAARDAGEISRVDLARTCRLSKATVTDLVRKLIRDGFLVETGKSDSTRLGGRKAILLRFNPLAGLVAGADIKLTSANVVITDLNAAPLARRRITYPERTTPADILSRIAATIGELLRRTGQPRTKLLGIGVGIPGLVDYHENALVFADTLKAWQGAPIGKVLERRFKVPIFVENDVKALSVGEYLFGSGKGVRDIVHLHIGSGIGAGIILNGMLHRGRTSSAGEIGYNEIGSVVSPKKNIPLLFHNQRTIGEILSDKNFVQSYLSKSTRAIAKTDDSVGVVVRRALTGDTIARRVLDEVTTLIGDVCINFVNMVNPTRIIISGRIAQSDPAVIDMIAQKVKQDILALPAATVEIRSAPHNEDAIGLGACGLILYELFEPAYSNTLRPSASAGL